jgi:protein O-GlcNAc transferase
MAPINLQYSFDLALQHHRAGRLHEAEQLFRQILAQEPEHFDALHRLGMIAHQTRRDDVAVELIRRAVALRPDCAEAYRDLGKALKDRGQIDEAIAAYRQAVLLNPKFTAAYNNLGNALQDKGQHDEAIAAHRQTIALNPKLPEARNNLGNALRNKGQLDEAISTFLSAIALRPNFPEAFNNLGIALHDKGRLDEAIGAYRQAIALRPNYAEAHGNLGNALRDKGQLDEAVAECQRAITLRANYAEAYGNLGNALKGMGQLDEAIAAWRQAIALRPGYAEIHSNLVFTLHYHAGYSAQAIAEEHRRWNVQHAEPFRTSIQSHPNERQPDRRLRIGYVSPDFRDHCQSLFTIGLLSHHDHERFEVFCYSSVTDPDEMTRRIMGCADTWRAVGEMSDAKVAEMVRADRIDILVDLTMHMSENRLLVFARKPSPVQVAWLAYPGTTGLTAMDYRLSDPYLDPRGTDESVYSERTIRLPDTFWCYDPVDGRDIPVNSLPALKSGRVTFGCLNNFCKVNNDVLSHWAKVLQQVENSRLLLLAPEGSHRPRTLERFRREGVDPGRVEFVPVQPRKKYLETYDRIDLGLDTFPYNGHTTSLDSFWMGVPVVTLVGTTVVGRAGWCQLSNLGLEELAGHTPEQYVRIAVELVKDLPRLARLRSTLRGRMEQSPLMDAPKFARSIEAAYRQMWHGWCKTT